MFRTPTARPVFVIPAFVGKNNSSRAEDTWEIHVNETPNQWLDSSFHCWTAGQGLAHKECFFTDTSNSQDQQTVTAATVTPIRFKPPP